jgi:HD superfamily phosphohydrolase YqeK
MNDLDKIVYIADKIEESRDEGIENIELERATSLVDLDKTMLIIIDGTIKKLIENKKLIHPNALLTRNALVDKLNQRKEQKKD